MIYSNRAFAQQKRQRDLELEFEGVAREFESGFWTDDDTDFQYFQPPAYREMSFLSPVG